MLLLLVSSGSGAWQYQGEDLWSTHPDRVWVTSPPASLLGQLHKLDWAPPPSAYVGVGDGNAPLLGLLTANPFGISEEGVGTQGAESEPPEVTDGGFD